jgi:dihydroorotase-like cyclic amidohydrolase
MVVDCVVKNCQIVRPDGIFHGGVAISNGMIVAIGKDEYLPTAREDIDAEGKFVLPGLIDPHVHWGVKKDFEHEVRTETRSCARGGVTTVMNLLGHAKTYTEESYFKTYEKWKESTERESAVDTVFSIHPHTPEHMREIPSYVSDLGVSCFKFFYGYKGEQARTIGVGSIDDGRLFEGFSAIGALKGAAIAQAHCEDVEVFYYFEEKLKPLFHTGLKIWTEARPGWLEGIDATHLIYLAEICRAPFYVVHISAKETVDALQSAKARGQIVFGETCPHYLCMTCNMEELGNLGKVNPALKYQEDIERIWKGIQEGTITVIGTDNVPVWQEHKKGTIWEAHPGIPNGSEIMLSVLVTKGVLEKRISLQKLVEITSYNTAKILGIYPRKGAIEIGSDADLVILDMQKEVEVSVRTLLTDTDFTIYDGWKLRGWPILTMVRGHVVYRDGHDMDSRGIGKVIRADRPRLW